MSSHRKSTVVIILGGGRGSRLPPLTRTRAKPAVGFGGKYRLIDIPIANCLRSRLDRIFVLTQFNSFSLNRHDWQVYTREIGRAGFVDVIAADQTPTSPNWFHGTADAVRRSLPNVRYHDPARALVASGDHVYSVDYGSLIQMHEANEADITMMAY